MSEGPLWHRGLTFRHLVIFHTYLLMGLWGCRGPKQMHKDTVSNVGGRVWAQPCCCLFRGCRIIRSWDRNMKQTGLRCVHAMAGSTINSTTLMQMNIFLQTPLVFLKKKKTLKMATFGSAGNALQSGTASRLSCKLYFPWLSICRTPFT